jgi:hypothetical protein
MAVMRHDRGVQPDQVAVRFWLDPIPPEDMPVLAARMLAEGHDTPALRLAAGFARDDDPRDVREAFGRVLGELGAWLPGRGAAELAAGISLARGLLSGGLPVAECSGRARGIWDFDDVIYPVLPGDLEELVLMCWLHSGEEYDVNGGDERLLAAARALAARSR